MPGMLRDNWKAALLIALAVAVSYGATAGYGFVMDDFSLVERNPNIKSLANIPHVLTSCYWDAEGYSRGLYRPLNILTYVLEYAVSGARPFIYHLDNLLLHALCSVLVYFLLAELLPAGRGPLFGALLFAVHPVHTEAVTWVSCRGELMSAAFALLSVITFVRSRRAGRRPYLSWAFFFLGCMSKESSAAVPALLAAYMLVYEDAEGFGDRARGIAQALVPYVILFAVFLAIRYAVLGFLSPEGIDQAFFGMPYVERVRTMSRALYDYVRLSFLPFDLRAEYLFPPPDSLLGIRTLLPFALLGAAAFLAPKYRMSHRWVFFALLWFLVALLPAMNIIPSHIIMSERVLYIPSVGACMALGVAFSSATSTNRARLVSTAAFAAVLAMFTVLTVERNRVWRDQDSYVKAYLIMAEEGIATHPDYPKLYKVRARVQTRFCGYGPEMEKAVFEAARVAGPGGFEVHSMLAWVYYCKGMNEEALAEMGETLRKFPSAHYTDFTAGILLRLGRYGEALVMADRAISLNPRRAGYYITRGNILYEMGKKDEALREFETAARLNPDDYAAHMSQGVVLEEMGELDRAAAEMERALSLRPDLPEVHYNAALTFMKLGDAERAERELRAALAIRPDYPAAAEALGRLVR